MVCMVILPRCGTPSKWHAQALKLSRALPTDVVLVIDEHVCDQGAVRCAGAEGVCGAVV